MSKQAVFFKRALALCLCCVIAGCTFSSLSAVKAKAEGTDFFNRWFSADNDSKWWDGNSYNGLTGPDGGFYINHPDGNWQYYHRWSATGGSARLDCNGPGLTLDLNEINRVDYTVNASKPVELWVQTYDLKEDGTRDENTRSFIKLADIAAGATSGSVELLKNAEVKAHITADKKIYIEGFSFYTKSFVYGDTIDVTAFSAGKAEETQEIDGFSQWFTAANDSKWWDGNSYSGLTNSDGGFYINHPDGNWQYYHRWSATGGSARLDCNGPGLTVDLNKTNRVDYAVNASKPVELWVQTYNLKEDGTKDGNTRSFTKLADIAAGETNGSVDLLKNSEIISRLTEDKKIYIDGFGFYTKSFVYGDTINVTAFSIVKGDVAQEINGFSRWFTSANNYNWWDGNSNRSYADAGDAWFIENTADSWTYKLGWSWDDNGNGRLDCNGPGLTVDLDEYNTINYNITVSRPITLYAQVYRIENGAVDFNTRTFIPLKSLDKGEWTESFDLRSSAELMKMCNSENSFLIAGFGFKTEGFQNADTVKVSAFTLSLNKEPYVPAVTKHAESWILNHTPTAWWSWDWNMSDSDMSRISGEADSKGGVKLNFKGDFEDLRYMASAYTVDLKTDPYFYARFDTDVPCELYLLVSGSPEGNNGIKISDKLYSGRVNEKFRISDIAALAPYIRNNSISVYGFRLIPQDDPTGKNIYFRTMDFGDMNFAVDLETVQRPAAPTLTSNTKEMTDAVEITVSGVPEAARLTQYRIGRHGEWQTYSGAVTIKKNIELFARYIDENGYWSIPGSFAVSNITKAPSEDAKPVIPNWFSPDTLTTCWYNWDWRYGSDDQDRFALDATDKYWTARVDKEWCKRIETQHSNSDFHCLIDLDEQTELFYKIDTQFELKISLKVKTGDANSSYATVPVGTLTAGKNSGSFNISDNSELLSISDDENKLTVSGVIFEFATTEGKCFTVERFLFDSEDAYYPGYGGQETVREITPTWFEPEQVNKWLNGKKQINISDNAATVEINTDNDWCATVNIAAEVSDITSNGTSVRINLQGANTLYLNTDNEFEADILLGIRSGGAVQYVKVGALQKGKNEQAIDLNNIEMLSQLANNGSLTVTGIRFVPQKAANGESLKVDLCAFNAAGKKYPGYEDTDKIKADEKAAAAVDQKIRAIGNVTLKSLDAIKAARSAYEALNSYQRSLVTEYAVLVNAENSYYALALANGIFTEELPLDMILSHISENPSSLIQINLTAAQKLPTQLLAAAKNNDCDIRVNIYDDKENELIYSMVLQSKDLTDTSAPFDTSLSSAEPKLTAAQKKALGAAKKLFYGMNKENRVTSYLIVMLNGKNSLFATDKNELYNFAVNDGFVLQSDYSAVRNNAVTLLIRSGGEYMLCEKNIVNATAANGLPTTGEKSNALPVILNLASIAMLAVLTFKMKKGKER